MDIKNIVNFIFEISQLKRQTHSGYMLAGVKHPTTVAEHSLRAAQIGYILAVMEGDANPEHVACILIIHDNPETRIGDQNKVSARYFSVKEAGKRAFGEQLELLGDRIQQKWHAYYEEIEERKTKEGIIAKDADWLEVAFQAKEYYDQGYQSTVDFLDNVEQAVETESAKRLVREMRQTKFTDWWDGLKKMTYKKLDQ
jgi:putative hydrolases of HD superfamily